MTLANDCIVYNYGQNHAKSCKKRLKMRRNGRNANDERPTDPSPNFVGIRVFRDVYASSWRKFNDSFSLTSQRSMRRRVIFNTTCGKRHPYYTVR